jgi:hypothetical protein
MTFQRIAMVLLAGLLLWQPASSAAQDSNDNVTVHVVQRGETLYRIAQQYNLTVEAIRRRIAEGATVDIFPLDERGLADVRELLNIYIQTLEVNNQPETAQHLYSLVARPQDHFIKIAPPMRKN